MRRTREVHQLARESETAQLVGPMVPALSCKIGINWAPALREAGRSTKGQRRTEVHAGRAKRGMPLIPDLLEPAVSGNASKKALHTVWLTDFNIL